MQDILSVTQLTFSIKKHLESRFTQVSVRGEISNFKEQSSGHLYFTLKDAESQISAVFFKGSLKGLARMPKNGDQVILKGELSVYAPRGNYQLIVRELSFAGVGELLLKLHELKLKLEGRGWFAKEAKKPLPKFPKTIGVVTSPTGSVIQDILQVLSRRSPGFHLILNPVKVQGEGAAIEIAQAIEQFNRYGLVDVLIVGRGGGSLEDLWAFNEEIVASAIYASKIPIISAVGHETDVCIADFVADVRAPTPSAAAEMALGEKAHHLQFLMQSQKRLQHTLTSHINQHHQMIDDRRTAFDQTMKSLLQQKRLMLAGRKRVQIALNPITQISSLRQKLGAWEKTLSGSIRPQIARRKEGLKRLVEHMKSIDPKNLLAKGYCILFDEKTDCVILNTQGIEVDQRLRILASDGQIITKVEEVKNGR